MHGLHKNVTNLFRLDNLVVDFVIVVWFFHELIVYSFQSFYKKISIISGALAGFFVIILEKQKTQSRQVTTQSRYDILATYKITFKSKQTGK